MPRSSNGSKGGCTPLNRCSRRKTLKNAILREALDLARAKKAILLSSSAPQVGCRSRRSVVDTLGHARSNVIRIKCALRVATSEVIGWVATTASISSKIRDMIVDCVKRPASVAPCNRCSGSPIQIIVACPPEAAALHLEPCFTPVGNAESNSMATTPTTRTPRLGYGPPREYILSQPAACPA